MDSLETLIAHAKEASYSAGDKLIISYHPIMLWSVSWPGRETTHSNNLEDALYRFTYLDEFEYGRDILQEIANTKVWEDDN